MSKIRSIWTKQEVMVHEHLVELGIPHLMHPKLTGHPDILFPLSKTVVFLDGCFWHRCPICYKEPGSNKDYWRHKINMNEQRDKLVTSELECEDWKVLRLWEHDLKHNFEETIKELSVL